VSELAVHFTLHIQGNGIKTME